VSTSETLVISLIRRTPRKPQNQSVILPGSARRRRKAAADAEDDAVSEKVDENRSWRRAAATPPRFDWRLAAACRDLDPDLFFPIGTAGPAVTQIAEAKEICLTCPVRTSCLDWALRHYQDYGIWGGTTERERQALRSAVNVRQQQRQRPA
jgi:WhiB family transcriptional regulator, redox-sensing transcriptional regulator